MPLIPVLRRQRQADFWVQGQSGLQSEFQDSQNYTEKLCLEKQNKTKQNQKRKKERFVDLSDVKGSVSSPHVVAHNNL
jgi:1,2-phenylacetyl-CoA epoxidase PaaB subunit